MKKLLLLLSIFLSLSTLPALAAGGTCPSGANYINPANPTGALVTLSSLGVTSCFYASKSGGANTNAGTTEAAPWKDLPGMPSCTGTCASTTPTNSEGFILKGGDTWTSTDLDLYWQWTGTSGHPIYIGVDPSWFTGSSWVRPIFTCGGAQCSYTLNGNGFFTDQSGIQYIYFDNIEMTGLFQTDTGSYYPNFASIYGSNDVFTRVYLHGWSHQSGGNNDNSRGFSPSTCCGGGLADRFFFDIVDGSDTTKDMLNAFGGTPAEVGYSIINDVTNGLEGQQNFVHDTLIENITLCFPTGGCHENAIQQAGAVSGSLALYYNNVITGVVSGGITKLWLGQASGGNPQTAYVFDNVMFNNVAGNDVNPCQLNTGSCGTYYYFNNTFQCGNSSGIGPCQAASGTLAPTQVSHWINNHCIASACVSISGDPNFTYTETDSLIQTVSQASAQGYTFNSTYAFQPTSGSGGTVNAGANEQSLCTTITAANAAAGAACKADTGYACNYNTSSHTITCPDRSENTRPASAAWDIGAYEFGGTPSAGTPTFLPIAGLYIGPQTVTISASSGSVICYNTTGSPATNGTTGCATGTHYTSPVTVAATETLFAVAGGSGFLDSSVASASYNIKAQGATPTFSPVAGTYAGTQSVTLATTAGGVICYSTSTTPATNGASGCTTGTLYTTAISVASSETIHAIAGGTGFADSTVGLAAYTITVPVIAPPTQFSGKISLSGAAAIVQ